MTPLRQRMIDDMRVRNYAERTVECYVSGVARFAKHFGRSPDALGADEIREYQRHLLERNLSWSTFNQIVCGLRFCQFFHWQVIAFHRKITPTKEPRRFNPHCGRGAVQSNCNLSGVLPGTLMATRPVTNGEHSR